MNLFLLKQIFIIRKRTLVVLGVLCATALALQLFITLYQNGRVERLQSEWMKLREQEGRGTAIQDREALYKSGMADLAKFRERVYHKNQFAKFIGELYEMASANGLDLTTITYKPSISKEDQFLHYALTLTVSGKYQQLKKFIYDLGKGNGNILVIDSLAMTTSASSPENVQLQVMITSLFRMESQ